MAIDIFISGHSVGTFNAVGVGLTEDGFKLKKKEMGEPINKSDAYGKTMLDWTYQGCDWTADFTCLAYKPGSISPFTPWAVLGTLGPIGKLSSDHGSAFVLTAAAGMTASLVPATVTGAKTCLPPDYEAELLFSSVARKVPIRLQYIPTIDAGVVKHFVLG
jgi:hypothetical protein